MVVSVTPGRARALTLGPGCPRRRGRVLVTHGSQSRCCQREAQSIEDEAVRAAVQLLQWTVRRGRPRSNQGQVSRSESDSEQVLPSYASHSQWPDTWQKATNLEKSLGRENLYHVTMTASDPRPGPVAAGARAETHPGRALIGESRFDSEFHRPYGQLSRIYC
jgi:hypothetical protein